MSTIKNAKSIKEVVEIALSTGNKYAEYEFAKMPIAQSKIIEKIIGIKLVGCDRVFDTNAVKHTLLKHGSELTEAKRGQVAVTLDDFAKLPMVLKEPDSINYVGKNKLKQDVFEYQKLIGDLYFVGEAVKIASAGNKLVFCTMYKRKQKTQSKR
jgi:phage-Barnase-EndoU-ColicinE5/D-RelE like nuclease3